LGGGGRHFLLTLAVHADLEEIKNLGRYPLRRRTAAARVTINLGKTSFSGPASDHSAAQLESNMGDENDTLGDMDRRAAEIIEELMKDGYPREDQVAIVTGALCMLLAYVAKNRKDLMNRLAHTKRVIEPAAKIYFGVK
jgi:hypothetical protein